MADFTDNGALISLQWVLGEGTPTRPSTFWIKLHTGDPGKDAANNAATETTRQQVTFDPAANILTDGRAQVATAATVTWTSVAATETYSHISIWDASTAGNPIFKGAMTASKAVTAGSDFIFPAGETIDLF